MLVVTLDHNCLIALEQNDPVAPDLRKLLELREAGSLRLAVPVVGGSEYRTDYTFADSLDPYLNRLAAVGLGGADLLPAPAVFGATFLDYMIPVSAADIDLHAKIHAVLFPGSPAAFEDFCKANGMSTEDPIANRRWRNMAWDSWGLWSHIKADADVFVTNDREFHKEHKTPRLVALGAKRIARPAEVIPYLEARRGQEPTR